MEVELRIELKRGASDEPAVDRGGKFVWAKVGREAQRGKVQQ